MYGNFLAMSAMAAAPQITNAPRQATLESPLSVAPCAYYIGNNPGEPNYNACGQNSLCITTSNIGAFGCCPIPSGVSSTSSNEFFSNCQWMINCVDSNSPATSFTAGDANIYSCPSPLHCATIMYTSGALKTISGFECNTSPSMTFTVGFSPTNGSSNGTAPMTSVSAGISSALHAPSAVPSSNPYYPTNSASATTSATSFTAAVQSPPSSTSNGDTSAASGQASAAATSSTSGADSPAQMSSVWSRLVGLAIFVLGVIA